MQSLTQLRAQRGVTLLESLVAVVVAALGILGLLGVQMRTLADTQTSVRRTQAIRLIEDLSDRLKANPNAVININSYVFAWGASLATPPACHAGNCNAANLAIFDRYHWQRTVQSTLPQGDATVFLAPGDAATNRRQLGVMIRWRENEKYATAAYKNPIDATKNGTTNMGGAVVCAAGFTCHLQYIPVSARCAPHFSGGASGPTRQFFCAGS